MGTMDKHVMEASGKARIVIRKGAVVEVGEPVIKECPLAEKFSQPVIDFNKASIKANMEDRIRKVGMFTKNRQLLCEEDFVPFGASEMIATGLRSGLIDAAVVVCDGAGTVIVTKPALVQGIGGRMSGLVSTSPIEETIEAVVQYGGHVLNPSTAKIDQVQGANFAKSLGYARIAVTVASTKDAQKVRKIDSEAMIIGVHLTGISKKEAELLVQCSDIVSGCASKWVRKVAGRVAILQAGAAIPVFALTKRGKMLIVEKIKETQHRLLIKVEHLPAKGQREPRPLV